MNGLITGGTGLIGAEVARILQEKDEQKPVVFDINPPPQRSGDLAQPAEVRRGDLGSFRDVLNAVAATRPDTILVRHRRLIEWGRAPFSPRRPSRPGCRRPVQSGATATRNKPE